MKKIVVLIVLSFTMACYLYSQEPIVKWGAPIEEFSEKNTRIDKMFVLDNVGLYATRKTTGAQTVERTWLEKYDNAYNKVFSKEIPLAEGVMGDNILYKNILPLKDGFLAFYSGFKKASKKSYYLVKKLSLDGDIDKQGTEIESITAEKAMNSGYFSVCLSPDQTKFLLLTTLPYDKVENAKIRIKAFDAQSLKELYTKDATLSFNCKGIFNDILIDNKGNAFIIERYVNDAKKYMFNLYTYNAASKEWKEKPVNLGDKFISETYKFFFDSKGDIVFSGFSYSKSVSDYNSLFYVRISASTFDITVSKTTGFGDVANKEKEDQMFTGWKLRGVVSQSNGNALIIAEDETENRLPPTTPGSFDFSYEYRNKNIKIACISPDGKKQWVTTIKKDQTIQTKNIDHRWDSFVYGLVNDKLYILYNNTELTRMIAPSWTDEGKKYKWSKDFAMNTGFPTFMYVIQPNGVSTYANKTYGLPLFNFQKGSMFEMELISSHFFPFKDGILIMSEMSDGKRYKFGKIEL